jgi:hypothetical protein
LTTLHLTGNRITDFSFLAGRSNLLSLSLDNNGIRSFRPPEPLRSLTFLDLGWNPLSDLSFLPLTPNLQQLILNGVGGSTLRFPPGAPGLQQVNLYNTNPTLVLAPDLQGPIRILCDSLPVVIVPAGLRERGLSVGDPPSSAINVIEYPPVPILSLSNVTSSSLELTFRAYPGAYHVLYSTDLDHWSESATLTNGLVVGNMQILLNPATPAAFYRVTP